MTVKLRLKKSKSMIADGYADVDATVDRSMMDDLYLADHVWSLVYRWGRSAKNSHPVFAAETKIGRGRPVQLHRYVMCCHADPVLAPKRYVIPRDGDALNCTAVNLDILSREQWEARTHRRSSDSLTETEEQWISDYRVARSLSRAGVIARAIRLLIAQEGGLPPAPTAPAPEQDWD